MFLTYIHHCPGPSTPASSRNREEQEYLEKLKQIRQQNYHERRNLQARHGGDAEAAAEERKKKAEALKVGGVVWGESLNMLAELKS